MRGMTPVGTIWRRALLRVNRRAARYIITRDPRDLELLAQAVRVANNLAR